MNEGQDRFGMKKTMISVGFENNSGQSLLKYLSPYLLNSRLEPSRVAFLSGIKTFVNSFSWVDDASGIVMGKKSGEGKVTYSFSTVF